MAAQKITVPIVYCIIEIVLPSEKPSIISSFTKLSFSETSPVSYTIPVASAAAVTAGINVLAIPNAAAPAPGPTDTFYLYIYTTK